MTGTCHCERVAVTLPAAPAFLYDCNCSLCRKSGGLWGYFKLREIAITGATATYRRCDREPTKGAMHFCGHCGSTVAWLPGGVSGDAVAAVNMRLFDPSALAGIAIEFPDGSNWSGEGPFGFRAEATTHGGISH
jgi:hypothetical protein